jgi:hypothetical protein
MPEETMGRENMPAPIAPPVIIATPPNIELAFVLVSASSVAFIVRIPAKSLFLVYYYE